jgi:hypothetical protein
MVAGSNDTRGTFSITTIPAFLGCTITFATAYATAPFCIITMGGNVALAGRAGVYSTSATTLNVSILGVTANSKLSYQCMQ